MQRYKRGSWSVACVVSGRSSWQAKGNNATGAKVKAFPMGVALFFCCPKLLGQLCSGEAQEGALSTFGCQGFSQKKCKNFLQIVVGAVTWVTCWQLVTSRTYQGSKRVVTKSSTVSSV